MTPPSVVALAPAAAEHAVGAGDLEKVWRREAPHVLGALLRQYAGDFSDCEDAAQEALIAAARQWPRDGVPDNPRAWLIRVGHRRLIDHVRSESARSAREQAEAVRRASDAEPARAEQPGADRDDTLQVLLMCAHSDISRAAQVALTLRAVAGLSTAQIAAAFLSPEATIAQRISRAKATLRAGGARFELPSARELPGRVAAVLDVLYLVFNEGYASSGGPGLIDVALGEEAIRLTRRLRAALSDHDEVAGALALMLLTSARTAARTDSSGELIPLAEQDRARWDADRIEEGVGLLEEVLPRGPVGPFQLQAAIAAVHAEAASFEQTDWPQILALYRMLDAIAPGPTVQLNLAVATGMVQGPLAGLAIIAPLLDQPRMNRYHRTHAVRAHLLEQAGEPEDAVRAYTRAATQTASIPEQRYLNARAAQLIHRDGSAAVTSAESTAAPGTDGTAGGASCPSASGGDRASRREGASGS